jgi:hypothetical protein
MSVSDLNTGCFDIVCNTVEYRKYNSILTKKKPEQAFNVYPNPANDKIFISLNNLDNNVNLTLTITDLSGKIIQSFEKNNLEKGIQLFGLSTENIANGLYLIQVQNHTAFGYKRISIIH